MYYLQAVNLPGLRVSVSPRFSNGITDLFEKCTFQCGRPKAGIPPGKSDASGGIGPKHIVTLTSGFSARCRPMRPIFPVEFQLKVD